MTTLNIVFFGTPEFSVSILKRMHDEGFTPSLIITAPDKKVGRKQNLTSPEVKVWALEHNIELWQPAHPREIIDQLKEREADLFVVAAYGYIVSQELLDIPKHGTLNVHTSLLPRFRGACPIESAILHGDQETGSTIMLMDVKMDHGPIISQERIPLHKNSNRVELFKELAIHGADLLVRTIPLWINKEITAQDQKHDEATFCYKIKKSDGNISNDDDATRYRKYLAYFGWPGVFFIDENNKRIKVTKAHLEKEVFIIDRVIPEGKNEMPYSQYIS